MNLEDLAVRTVDVYLKGRGTVTLAAPAYSKALELQVAHAASTQSKIDPTVSYANIMVRATMATTGTSQEVAERLIVQTGLLTSPIGKAAMMLCGFGGTEDDPDDVPT